MHYSTYTPAMYVHCVMPAIITAGKNDTKQQSILTLTDPLQSVVGQCDQIVYKSGNILINALYDSGYP